MAKVLIKNGRVLVRNDRVVTTDGGACECCGGPSGCIRIQQSPRIYQGVFTPNPPFQGNIVVPLNYCCSLVDRNITGSFKYIAEWQYVQSCPGSGTGTYRIAFEINGVLNRVWNPGLGTWQYFFDYTVVGTRYAFCSFPQKNFAYSSATGNITGCNPLVTIRSWGLSIADPDNVGQTISIPSNGNTGVWTIAENLTPSSFTINKTYVYGSTNPFDTTQASDSMVMSVTATDPCLATNDCALPGIMDDGNPDPSMTGAEAFL